MSKLIYAGDTFSINNENYISYYTNPLKINEEDGLMGLYKGTEMNRRLETFSIDDAIEMLEYSGYIVKCG